MSSTEQPTILAITGLPASGKNTFGEIAQEMGFKIVVMGDVIRNEVKARGLTVNRDNSNIIMMDLRSQHGKEAVAVKTVEVVEELIKQNNKLIIIDGVRSWDEIELFKKKFTNLKILGIHASPLNRLDRIEKRSRIDDPTNAEAFDKRDRLELDLGIGGVIARADYLIIPSNNIDEAKELYREFLMDFMESEK
jgi:dephospho-CoA kinase